MVGLETATRNYGLTKRLNAERCRDTEATGEELSPRQTLADDGCASARVARHYRWAVGASSVRE